MSALILSSAASRFLGDALGFFLFLLEGMAGALSEEAPLPGEKCVNGAIVKEKSRFEKNTTAMATLIDGD